MNKNAKRSFDTTDSKWAHPDLKDCWTLGGFNRTMIDNSIPVEQRRAMIEGMDVSAMAGERGAFCDIKEYEVPGCALEPQTPVKVLVYTPKELKTKKAKTIFFLCGGALVTCFPEIHPIEPLCQKHKCIAVVPVYRTSLYAKYPAAINDCHAAYEWMLQNAAQLRINPDKVVLHGSSSGGHLALALPFRLMAYGHKIRGVVSCMPITDDRCTHASNTIEHPDWSGKNMHDSYYQWLGEDMASPSIGPEAFANRASAEECKGYPPVFIHTPELDCDRDSTREFVGKLLEARTFVEHHIWGGLNHASMSSYFGTDYGKRVEELISNNIEDCFNHDLSRPWTIQD